MDLCLSLSFTCSRYISGCSRGVCVCEKAFFIYESHSTSFCLAHICAGGERAGEGEKGCAFLCMGIYHKHSRTRLEPELLPLFVINTCVLVAQLDRVPRARKSVLPSLVVCRWPQSLSLLMHVDTHTNFFLRNLCV